jgi:uncharacterized protein with FMN-binding domain
MRRAPIVLTSTVAGLVAVLTFHAREPTLSTAAAHATGSTGATTTPDAASSSSSGGSSSPSGASSSSGSSTGTKTATGDAIDTQYGDAQVKVTVTDGKITDVTALQLQGNDPKSVQISWGAEPSLRASALQKQSAAIDAVSGATVTSASYEASLQSALDKLGFKAAEGSRGTSTVPQVEEHGDHGGGPGGDPSDQLFTQP